MKFNFLTRRSILSVYFSLGIITQTQAQSQKLDVIDSLHCNYSSCITNGTHDISWKEIVIPTSLIGISALYVESGWLKKQRESVQDVLSAKGSNKTKVDDYIQYAPMVAAYGLELFKIKPKHSFKERTITLAMSYATMAIVVRTMKIAFNEKRPDSNAKNSFPSGHTATAFMGAHFLYEEYKEISPWIGYAGYAIATTTGYLRIYNNRHYFNDVIAGACLGILSTKFAYWLYPKIFRKSKCNKNLYKVETIPFYSEYGAGISLALQF